MDDKGRRSPESDDTRDFKPSWPQRPGSERPRLDPPEPSQQPTARGQDARRPASGSGAWTSTPTSHTSSGHPVADPKSTRVLPRQDVPRPAPPPKAQPPQQPASRQAQREPGGKQYERYDHTPREPRPYTGSEPYEEPDSYAGHTRAYSTTQRANVQTRLDPRAKYLSADDTERRPTRFRWVGLLLGGLIGLALIVVTAFSLAWQGQYAGKVYAGVRVLGIGVGGKTADEAEALIRERVKPFVTEPVVLAWRGQEWRPSLDDLGIRLSVDATVEEAFNVGRTGDFFGNIAQQWASAQTGYNVPLTVQVSEPRMQEYLNSIADSTINQELFEGDVRLAGTQIEAMPGKEGRTLDTYATISTIREAAAKLEPNKRIELPVTIVQPTVSAEEVRAVEALLAIRVSGPITATAFTNTFGLDRDALIRFTVIQRDPNRDADRHIQLGWNDRELETVAAGWVEQANRAPRDARFAWNGGQLAVLTESIDGFETSLESVVAAVKQNADTSDRRTFELPGKVITPTVSSKDLPALGIKELMGTGTSTFQGSSQERATNIRVASDLLNGAVVPPGGTFSFLKTMGGIDEAHGFVEGYVIAAERTQRGVGGGVCQVSTTMFRAAFWSGLDITERNQHSYRVSWYEAGGEPVGFDAAVFDPGVDLKLVNNTPSYVLIEAVVGADNVLRVNVYGTKLPGEVKLEGPAITNRTNPPPDVYEVDPRLPAGTRKQVETARAGLDTTITRRIVVPGQPDKVDEFRSSYQAWPNWYIVASASQIPGNARPAQNPTPNP
jgi:vancomycin resistance protein YoaR